MNNIEYKMHRFNESYGIWNEIISSIHAKHTHDECQPYQIIMYESKGLDDNEYPHMDTSSLRCVCVLSKVSMATLLVTWQNVTHF